MLKYITFIFALFASVEATAQNVETQPLMQQPEQIADTLLQGDIAPRAEMTGEEMLVPDSMTRYALPMLHFSAPGFNGFSPWNYGAMPVWQMHEGFNAKLGLSLTAGFGKGAPHGVGFSQQAAFGYAMPLSKRFAVAAGIYANNMDWGAFNDREVGLAAAVQYRVNDAVNVYAYGAKSFFPNGRNRQLRYNFLTGYATPAPLPAYFWGIPSERFGAMAEFKLGKNAMIQVSVEHQKY